MKNILMTIGFFVLTFILSVLLVYLFAYLSNKVFDQTPDYIYIPTLCFFWGLTPLLVATKMAIEITNSEKFTKYTIVTLFSMLTIVALFISIWLTIGLIIAIIIIIFFEDWI